MFWNKPICTFVLWVITEIEQGRYLREKDRANPFMGPIPTYFTAFSKDAGSQHLASWRIDSNGGLARKGQEVPINWRERRALRKVWRIVRDQAVKDHKEYAEKLRY